MDLHRGNDSSIVNLNSRDSVLQYELSPSRENLWCLRDNSQKRLKAIHVSGRLLRRQAQTIGVGRSRRGAPEFDQVLREAEKFLALMKKTLYRAARRCA
jgi:hypothetical protein